MKTLTNFLKNQPGDEKRAARMKRRHPAVEVVVRFPARRQHEFAAAQRICADDFGKLLTCFRHTGGVYHYRVVVDWRDVA